MQGWRRQERRGQMEQKSKGKKAVEIGKKGRKRQRRNMDGKRGETEGEQQKDMEGQQ